MAGETRRKFDQDFREGAVRLVRETGKPIAQVARDLGVNEGTLGNWVNADRRRRDGGDGQLSEDERAELVRLRRENAKLQMERDVLKRSVALWLTGQSRLILWITRGRAGSYCLGSRRARSRRRMVSSWRRTLAARASRLRRSWSIWTVRPVRVLASWPRVRCSSMTARRSARR